MKQVKKRVVCLSLGIILVLFSFSGCSKKITGKWKPDPIRVKNVKVASKYTYDDGSVYENNDLFNKIDKLAPGRIMSLHIFEYTNGQKRASITYRLEDRKERLIMQKCLKGEPMSEEDKAALEDFMGFIKEFHKKGLSNFDSKEYTIVELSLWDNYENAAVFRFWSTENDEYSWKPIDIGYIKIADLEKAPSEWKELLDKDKFFTQNYARGEEPEYVE